MKKLNKELILLESVPCLLKKRENAALAVKQHGNTSEGDDFLLFSPEFQ